MNTNLMSNLELFEILNDRVSEKISGGSGLDAQLVEDLMITTITDDPNLQIKIVEQVKKFFPEGVGNATSLSCAQDHKHLKCEVSSNGEKGHFMIPLK